MYKIVSILICMVSLLACSAESVEEGNQKLQGQLSKAIKEAQSNQDSIEFKEIADFPWDRMFIFPPYTPVETINEELGVSWSKVGSTGIQNRDDINLIVFVKDNKVVRYLEYPRGQGDFADIKKTGGFEPEAAVFQVVKEQIGGQEWIQLRQYE
ncbi:hypothetical protein BEP19_03020 [Ammoniphilus oxalaticus]|uniref:Lipoprotein n=1 Tax=Ammoniphilus oxalaticus TaxID=66863 RepID=A0A419SNP3_9BACL|nr:hypothetical protein [Ammoniphilus oxalaticus]RKD25916.1 hypothetical protein BEP19_03020 [Ammoniphilus oxalaticus]